MGSAWALISTHFPPPVMTESTAVRATTTHILCCSCGMYFSAAASSENDHGSMNLASNTASLPSTRPSRVAPIQRSTGWRILRWTSTTTWPVVASYQRRLRSSVARPSWTTRLPDRSSGSTSPRFSRQSLRSAASSSPMMIRASEPPMKYLRLEGSGVFNTPDFILHHLIYTHPVGIYSPIWVNITHMGLGVNQKSVCIDWRPDQIGARTIEMECARSRTTCVLGREHDPTGGS